LAHDGPQQGALQLTAAVLDKRGAVITGAAGVGKTTLAMACLKAAESRGISLARMTATRASRGLPFGAFAPMLPADSYEDEQRREDRGALLRRYAWPLSSGQRVVHRTGGVWLTRGRPTG